MDDRNSAAGRALTLMEEALALLDVADAPADIGAHLDLAVERLRSCYGCLNTPASFKPQVISSAK